VTNDIMGNNYLSCILDVEIHLYAMNYGDVIKEKKNTHTHNIFYELILNMSNFQNLNLSPMILWTIITYLGY